jgi:hypothetical protein
MTRGKRSGLPAVRHAELAEDAQDVVFDSSRAKEELGGDFRVGQALT